MKNFFILVFSCCLLFTSFGIARADFYEDFSGDFSQWVLRDGVWPNWHLVDEHCYLHMLTTHSRDAIMPTDVAWGNMSEYQVDFTFTPFDTFEKHFVVGDDGTYFYDMYFLQGEVILNKVFIIGSEQNQTFPSIVWEINRSYHIRILFTREKIQLWIDGQEIFSTDESWLPIHIGGKFTLVAKTQDGYSIANYDDIVVKDLSTTEVSLWKQMDSRWAQEIYDHTAGKLTAPYMKNWGCAVTSAAMILRYYGFTQLPDGQQLDPDSLNKWLQSQADGYLGIGLVNWLAISRLTSLLATTENGLPDLEFTPFSGSKQELSSMMIENLAQKWPLIGHIPGHFFVISNYDDLRADYMIRDPFYDYDWLMQHGKELDGIRFFQPNHTDLSAQLLVLPKDWQVIVKVKEEVLPTVEVDESIFYRDQNLGADWKMVYIMKPITANYQWQIFPATAITPEQWQQLQFLSYGTNGVSKVFSLAEVFPVDMPIHHLQELDLTVGYSAQINAHTMLMGTSQEKTAEQLRDDRLQLVAEQAEQQFHAGQLSFYLFYQLEKLLEAIWLHFDYYPLLDVFFNFYQLDSLAKIGL